MNIGDIIRSQSERIETITPNELHPNTEGVQKLQYL